MSDFNRGYAPPTPAAPADMAVDSGLRAFMLGVYNKMMLGLILAAGIAWTVSNVEPVAQMLYRTLGDRIVGFTPLGWVVAFAPLGVILASNFLMRRMTPASSAMLFWGLVVLIGASLGTVFMVYQVGSVISAFLITAASFGGLSLVGYTTKRDLSPFGSFLIMGVWGIIITSIVTMFIPGLSSNPTFFYMFNIVALLIFAGVVAWQTQALKMSYYDVRGDGASMAVATNIGALSLFIAFVNLFQTILALMGGRRE